MTNTKSTQNLPTLTKPQLTKIDYSKITDPKKLKKIKDELEHRLKTEQEKIAKFINIAELREKRIQQRKKRSKMLYDVGGLFAIVLGDRFYDFIENPQIKEIIVGLIVRITNELDNNGGKINVDDNKSWLEHHRQLGSNFWSNHINQKKSNK